MEGQRLPQSHTKLHKLEVENQRLEEELRQPRQEHQDTKKVMEERQVMEAYYQQSQLRFRTIFEQSLLGNKILASDLFIRQVNPALVTLLGYTRKKRLLVPAF
jgi:two-component system sensor histidine kinase VicK